VAWVGEPPGEAKQIVAPTLGEAWFDPADMILFRRELADLLAAASPRDFVVREYPSVG
jgi:hypothetical protein